MNKPTQGINISLNAKSLLELIKVLKNNKATEFKYGELHIKFGPEELEAVPAITAGISRTAEKNEPDEREEMDNLMISNPAAYEERLHAQLDRFDEPSDGQLSGN